MTRTNISPLEAEQLEGDLSLCCNATASVVGNNGGEADTMYWVCSTCHKPCDVKSYWPQESVGKTDELILDKELTIAAGKEAQKEINLTLYKAELIEKIEKIITEIDTESAWFNGYRVALHKVKKLIQGEQ